MKKLTFLISPAGLQSHFCRGPASCVPVSLVVALVWLPVPAAAQSSTSKATVAFLHLAQNEDFGATGENGVSLARPRPGRTHEEVRTVDVKGMGASSEEAQKDAARQAIQQVAGLFIDARRQVETRVTDQAISDIVHEKILSYSNAFITKLEVLSAAKQPDGLIVVAARVTVAVAPLLKTLQSNNVPTVAFDTKTAVGQMEVSANAAQNAIDLYADLVKRSPDLVTLSVGTPKVNAALQAPAGKSWLTLPITFTATETAIKDWRSKFEQIAAKHMTLEMPIQSQALNGNDPEHSCAAPVFDAVTGLNHVALQQTFLGTSIPSDRQGITACFADGRGSSTVSVDCFGQTFPTDARPAADICDGPSCLSLGDTARTFGIRIELVDVGSDVIESIPIHFISFPMISVANSAATPPPGAPAFFNYCGPTQDPFYFYGRYFGAYGDVIVFPASGSRLHAYGNVLLPNNVIAKTATIRIRIVQGLGASR